MDVLGALYLLSIKHQNVGIDFDIHAAGKEGEDQCSADQEIASIYDLCFSLECRPHLPHTYCMLNEHIRRT